MGSVMEEVVVWLDETDWLLIIFEMNNTLLLLSLCNGPKILVSIIKFVYLTMVLSLNLSIIVGFDSKFCLYLVAKILKYLWRFALSKFLGECRYECQ